MVLSSWAQLPAALAILLRLLAILFRLRPTLTATVLMISSSGHPMLIRGSGKPLLCSAKTAKPVTILAKPLTLATLTMTQPMAQLVLLSKGRKD